MKIEAAKIKQRDELVAALFKARNKLRREIDNFNNMMENQHDQLESSVVEYNELIDEVREFTQDVVGDIDAEIADTPDTERGEALCELRDQWDITFDDVELDDIQYVDTPDSIADELQSLPTEA